MLIPCLGDQHRPLSSCPSWTPSHHSSCSASLVSHIQSPSPVDSPSPATLQSGAAPSSHSKCFAPHPSLFYTWSITAVASMDFLSLLTSPQTPHHGRDLVFALLVPTSQPIFQPLLGSIRGTRLTRCPGFLSHHVVGHPWEPPLMLGQI